MKRAYEDNAVDIIVSVRADTSSCKETFDGQAIT